jgi:hypothetical protein
MASEHTSVFAFTAAHQDDVESLWREEVKRQKQRVRCTEVLCRQQLLLLLRSMYDTRTGRNLATWLGTT